MPPTARRCSPACHRAGFSRPRAGDPALDRAQIQFRLIRSLAAISRHNDAANQAVYRKTKPSPLVIPENAVIVPGSRPLDTDWGRQTGLSLATPVFVKYRDGKTDAATALEDLLR